VRRSFRLAHLSTTSLLPRIVSTNDEATRISTTEGIRICSVYGTSRVEPSADRPRGRSLRACRVLRAANERVSVRAFDPDAKAVASQEDIGGGESDALIAVEEAGLLPSDSISAAASSSMEL
jgi:hypothetical protein